MTDEIEITSREAVERPLDEAFDTHIEVALNHYGAWQAIQSLAARLAALEEEHTVSYLAGSFDGRKRSERERERAEAAEAKLAVARDALENATWEYNGPDDDKPEWVTRMEQALARIDADAPARPAPVTVETAASRAAYLAGVEAALEAAAEAAKTAAGTGLKAPGAHEAARQIRALDPAAIAREAQKENPNG